MYRYPVHLFLQCDTADLILSLVTSTAIREFGSQQSGRTYLEVMKVRSEMPDSRRYQDISESTLEDRYHILLRFGRVHLSALELNPIYPVLVKPSYLCM